MLSKQDQLLKNEKRDTSSYAHSGYYKQQPQSYSDDSNYRNCNRRSDIQSNDSYKNRDVLKNVDNRLSSNYAAAVDDDDDIDDSNYSNARHNHPSFQSSNNYKQPSREIENQRSNNVVSCIGFSDDIKDRARQYIEEFEMNRGGVADTFKNSNIRLKSTGRSNGNDMYASNSSSTHNYYDHNSFAVVTKPSIKSTRPW